MDRFKGSDDFRYRFGWSSRFGLIQASIQFCCHQNFHKRIFVTEMRKECPFGYTSGLNNLFYPQCFVAAPLNNLL